MSDTKPDLMFDERAIERAITNDITRSTQDFDDAATMEYSAASDDDEIAAELLNKLDAGVPAGEPSALRLHRRVASLIDTAKQASREGDLSRARIAIELAIHEAPTLEVARRTVRERCPQLESLLAALSEDL